MNYFQTLLKERYLSYEDDLIEDFYKPVLSHSILYKRMAGYFSSNLIELLYNELKETSTFDNLKIKIICSPELSNEDKDNILKGYAYKQILEEKIIKDIKELEAEDHSLPLITKLILDEVIDIKFVVSNSGKGLFHAKEGIFVDSLDNKIAFTGSNNKTFSAVRHNFETTTVFFGSRHDHLINNINSLFEDIWNDRKPELMQVNLTEKIIENFRELYKRVSEEDVIKEKSNKLNVAEKIELYPYQKAAVDNWKENNYQ